MGMMQMAILAAGVLAVLFLLIFAFAGPSASRAGAKRLDKLKYRHSDNADVRVEAQMKKALSARRKTTRPKGENMTKLEILAIRMEKTGKNWPLSYFFYAAGGLFLLASGLLLLKGAPILLCLFVGLLLGAGLPHFIVGFLINRRVGKFTASFPDAIELLVRGLRSGLPVTETIGVVAKEVGGPVGEEFRKVVDRIKIGQTMEDALQESAKRMDTPEFQFFCITLAIQRETGGNLAETLSNLADVLRKRGQMKLKIKAMSSESKASAYIVGSLPFIVFALVYSVNPTYLAGFFYEERLIVAGMGGLCWMGIGVFIMAKMVSFEI
ncbi:MAG: type II secretion system F family protein [Sphingomonadales bacterium]|nr:type II secretion system F family protein [Sphingomonadales bacterium]NCO47765.1 type II secretion system F family protein [Sphingomonadales bacterium]NCO99690.1 type II secretion system F family protein [Sphingomonadales bacterium]NCP27530.1 type II secretion system F family protein [Sphingomonadales bacterium]NCP43351.1 type II secretion system F family protein [Sphingomonadales bacterium]